MSETTHREERSDERVNIGDVVQMIVDQATRDHGRLTPSSILMLGSIAREAKALLADLAAARAENERLAAENARFRDMIGAGDMKFHTHDDPGCMAVNCDLDHAAIREEMRLGREQPLAENEEWAFGKLRQAVIRHELHWHDCQTTWCTMRFIFDSVEWTEILADAYRRGEAEPEVKAKMRDLADEWDGGAEAGREHIMACAEQPCPRCVLAEAAIELRELEAQRLRADRAEAATAQIAAQFLAREGAADLIPALEALRRQLCPYFGPTCDCKYGASGMGEQTGCPELRQAIAALATTGEPGEETQR